MKPTGAGVRLVTIFALFAGSAWAAKFALLQPIPEVKLKDGTVLHDVTFVSVGGASITGKWDGGRGSIPLAQLPDDVRSDLVQAAAAKPASIPASAPAAPAAPAAHAAPGAASPAGNAVDLPQEIKLSNGFVMHQAKVISWQADAMTVNYVGGQVLVKFANLDPEQRKIFEAHLVLVRASQARIDAVRAARKSGAPIPADLAQPSAEERQILIEAAISSHELMVGMTKKEVFLSLGAPARTGTDSTAPDYLYWFYPGKGRDEKGAVCDRIVGFNKGRLDGWKDQ